MSIVRVAKLTTGDLWRYAVLPVHSIDKKRKAALTADDHVPIRWGAWRSLLTATQDATSVWVATESSAYGEWLADQVRQQVLEVRPEIEVFRLHLPDLTGPTFERAQRERATIDRNLSESHATEAAVNRLIATALQRTINGGGRNVAPALAILGKLHGVRGYEVRAGEVVLRSRGPWEGGEVPEVLTVTRRTTTETWTPTAPTVVSVMSESTARALETFHTLQQLYDQGFVGWGPVDGRAVVAALTELGVRPGAEPQGGDVRPVDPRLLPSDIPQSLYPAYLTLWAQTLASGATPATVEITTASAHGLEARSVVPIDPGYLRVRIDRPLGVPTHFPDQLRVDTQREFDWGLTEAELFERFAAEGLRYRNPAWILKLLENLSYVEFRDARVTPTDECAAHLLALTRCAPSLTKPTFFAQCEARVAAVARGDTDRKTVISEYRRWVEGIAS